MLVATVLAPRPTLAKDCLHLARFSGHHCETERVSCSGFATRGMFSSCHQEFLSSCTELARGLIENTQAVPLTVLVDENLFHNDRACEAFANLMKHPESSRLQLVPVQEPAKYMRDPGVLLSRKYLALPYGMMGAKSVAAVLSRCESLEVERGLAADSEADLMHEDVFNNHLDAKTFAHRMEGGNVLWIPRGPLVIGQTERRQVTSKITEPLARYQSVLKVPIPDLQVGHIDEIFSVVGAKSKCGYEILAASPNEMKEFLRAQNGLIVYSQKPNSHLNESIKERFSDLESKIAQRQNEGRPLPKSWVKEREALARQALESKGLRNQTAAQVLADAALMGLWDQWQTKIGLAKKQIQSSIAQLDPKCAKVRFVDIPVFWNHAGEAPLSNPINGMYVNGRYLLSRPHRLLVKGAEWNTESLNIQIINDVVDFPAYEQDLARRLPELDVRYLRLSQYDLWGGNLHCATLQIQETCAERKSH